MRTHEDHREASSREDRTHRPGRSLARRMKRRLALLARSLGVGALATVVDLASLWLLVEIVGIAPWLANVPALGAGLLVQFAGNKYFAFKDRSRALLRQGSQFALVEVGALGLNALGFHLAVTLLACPYLLARLGCSALVYLAYSFPLWGRIFTHQPPTGLAAETAAGD